MKRINTSSIQDFVRSRDTARKQYEHSEKFVAKKAKTEEEKLHDKLVAKIKSEDPTPFMNDENLVKITREPGEIYKLIPTTYRYYVSNLGNALKVVYDKRADKFIEHSLSLINSVNKTKRIYVDINVQLCSGEHIRCRLSRAMAKAFLDPTFPLLFDSSNKLIVDHKDNNSENNVLSNIRICTQKENLEFAVNQQGRNVGMPKRVCYAYNIDTQELRQYNSTAKLVQDIFSKDNNGWFNTYNRNKSFTKDGWTVGYDPAELKTRVRKEKYRGGRKKRI